MARKVELHPDDASVEAFLHGRLSPKDAAALERHLEKCASCGERLARVGDDTFSELVRDGATAAVRTSPAAGLASDALADIPPELRDHPRYAIESRIASGGMGVVYRATHRMMRRAVALKVIRPDLVATPAAVSRFRREVHAAAALSHPNIVTAHDAEEVAGVHFLAMEFVDGESFEQLVRRRGPLPSAEACGLVRQAALGLAHAHSQGMIHRDIKPGNLMLDRGGTVKILDFGLAGWAATDGDTTAESMTQFGARIGTPAYAAPEQFPARRPVDARADQFGLGATLVFLLTGRTPTNDPTAPQLPRETSAAVRAIVAKLTAEAPDARFASAAAVADALAPWCDPPRENTASPNATAKRPSPTGISKRAALVGAIVAAVVIAVVGVAWKFVPTQQTPVVKKQANERSVLFLLPSQDLWHEDYLPVRKAIASAGHRAIVATPQGTPAKLHIRSEAGTANRPESVATDLDVHRVDLAKIDAVVCVGYDHSEFTSGDTPIGRQTMKLLTNARDGKKWIVGICAGQHVVGAAGLLRGVKVAEPSQYFDNPAAMGAIPQPNRRVVVDGRIITATSPQDAGDAAAQLIRALE